MAGTISRPINRSSERSLEKAPAVQSGLAAPDNMVDIDDDGFDVDEQDLSLGDTDLAFQKPTDVRRRLEEKLEVRQLRDELGMDDFDL